MAESFAATLVGIVGQRNVRSAGDIPEHYRVDVMRKFASQPAWLAKPETTAQVAQIMRAAYSASVPVTVVGGQTGTSGAAVPSDGGLALSLEHMNRIGEIDRISMTMEVDAGCILQHVQEAAEAQQCFLPLDLGARGSATVGGVIGTNAGGNRVLRWGMMRDMVIGLEAVLADGTVVSSLTRMLKDNAGYHWKHLLIGSEGTLGIVTKAVLRLRPLPTTHQTALIAAESFEAMIGVLRRLEVSLSGQLSSFELMWDDFYTTVTEAQLDERPRPMAAGRGIYALVEAMGGNADHDAEIFEQALMELLEEGLVADAVIAQSARERDAIWAVREDLQPAFAPRRPFVSYDVSMAIADMPRFVESARNALNAACPEASILFYGHAGDGNLHANVSMGRLDDAIKETFDTAIFGVVRELGGSISAEHGIGIDRTPYLAWTRSEEEMALMKTLKRALDPKGILNPGKVLPVD
ncbi:MAG: FAD-binding oxidoreductase [Novosphingobium sp.]|nr:FAD-binding oxidoreductase [Novosphingobium sp.]